MKQCIYGKEKNAVKTSSRKVNTFRKSKTKKISEGETDSEATPGAGKEVGGIGCRETCA
jgi:hypothetical protein